MEKKVVLVVMDGVGKSTTGLGDAVTLANTPTLDKLLAECPHTYIKAHGTAVGTRRARNLWRRRSKAAPFSRRRLGRNLPQIA